MANNTSRLPSYQCAIDFVEAPNIPNTINVLGSWVGRALIVAAGMAVSGKDFEESIKNGMIAATTIEIFVLGHALYSVKYLGSEETSK